jgi:hypothetical protein
LTLSGMQAGGYDLPALTDAGIGTALNVQTAIDSSNRILVSKIISTLKYISKYNFAVYVLEGFV